MSSRPFFHHQLLSAFAALATFSSGVQAQNPASNAASTADAAPIPLTEATLEAGWNNPPRDARLRAYWWWLNGNVTKAGITRDLEEMKRKGFGGALICDAGGAEQDGNDRVPHGPTFFTPEWREVYKHTLREANRLGLEMSLNIQSGWNLGGPNVSAQDAAQKLVWSQRSVVGPTKFNEKLVEPTHADSYYRDLFVVAYRTKNAAATPQTFSASSAQAEHAANAAFDGDNQTFWVSSGTEAGQGPTRLKPQWLQMSFPREISVNGFTLQGRDDYGPREGELQVSDDGTNFRSVKTFGGAKTGPLSVTFAPIKARHFRLLVFGAFDPRFADNARNVQIAEWRLNGSDAGGKAVSWPLVNTSTRQPIRNLAQKAMQRALSFSAPDTSPLLSDFPATVGEADTNASEVIDLSSKINAQGVLNWDAPDGNWQIVRFGSTVGDHSRVSTSSDGWKGYALDVLDKAAFKRYWDSVVEPLIADAGPLAGSTLKYLHTDSWEVEAINWTPTLRQEFRSRRGYDLLPYLPILAGALVDDRDASNRFLHDFRKTLGDLAVDNHFKPFAQWSKRHNLLIHPESGGPHAVPIDAQRTLGQNDAPMSEFWAESPRHRIGDANRFFVKQPASAAHTYGKKLVLAEGFTTIGPHWQETIWDNLKPSFDFALTEGLNLLVWHAMVSSPDEMGLPGQQYFAGTHFNRQTTWWEKSTPFLSYINRSQWLMQQGQSVSDVAYYYGDHVPNFTQLRSSDPAKIGKGYDYDVITEEAILSRLSVRDNRLVLPDGTSYRVLVLPQRTTLSLSVLRHLQVLADGGATIIGPKPSNDSGLHLRAVHDKQVRQIADKMWGQKNDKVGKGRVIAAKTARQVLADDGIAPDFSSSAGGEALNYIHRRAGQSEIYFVANRAKTALDAVCTFRVTGKAPELWNAVSGERRFATNYTQKNGLTSLPLQFAPCGSWFVIFRAPATAHPSSGKPNSPQFAPRATLDGAWQVSFDARWGGPPNTTFDTLQSWTKREESGIRFYSGMAIYRKTFDLAPELRRPNVPLMLDLGNVREVAQVRLNGQDLGIVWAPPFRVDISRAAKTTGNQLEIEVVNFWPNRIIGDAALPVAQRLTRTNVRKLSPDTPLMESGLLGPVQVLAPAP